MKLEFAAVNITEITTDMRSLFNPLAKNKDLELIVGTLKSREHQYG